MATCDAVRNKIECKEQKCAPLLSAAYFFFVRFFFYFHLILSLEEKKRYKIRDTSIQNWRHPNPIQADSNSNALLLHVIHVTVFVVTGKIRIADLFRFGKYITHFSPQIRR